MIIYPNLEDYSLEKCLCGDCKGCDREHYASCGELIESLKELHAQKNTTYAPFDVSVVQ